MVTTITFHYWILDFLIKLVPDPETDHSHFLRSLSLLLLLVVAHVLEILAFALGYLAGVELLGWNPDAIGQNGLLTFIDFFYYSAVSYSTLGMASVPAGDLRFMTAMESLTGIIILTWSATFFYNVLGRSPSTEREG